VKLLKADFLKNRTVLGAVCVIAALIIGFVLTPMFTNVLGATETVVRAKQDIPAGTQIINSMVESVKMGRQNLPAGTETNLKNVVGKYAAIDITDEDLITTAKISANSGIYNLKSGQILVSVSVKDLADSVSGKLQSGDVVTVYLPPSANSVATASSNQMSVVPPQLEYVEVAAVTASNGADVDPAQYKTVSGSNSNNNNNSNLPTTVTLLVNEQQAQILTTQDNGIIHFALAAKSGQYAQQLLQKQADYFISGALSDASSSKSAGLTSSAASSSKSTGLTSSATSSSKSTGLTSSATSSSKMAASSSSSTASSSGVTK